jgi:hypothetical protein
MVRSFVCSGDGHANHLVTPFRLCYRVTIPEKSVAADKFQRSWEYALGSNTIAAAILAGSKTCRNQPWLLLQPLLSPGLSPGNTRRITTVISL